MSDQTLLWLLDKNVVRNALRALVRLDLALPPGDDDLPFLEILRAAREGRVHSAISPELAHILRRRAHQPVVRAVLATLSPFQSTRYFKRWARRLRAEGFTYEDAKVIALGTFGTDETGIRLGASAIITGDLHLMRNYGNRLPTIQRRLKALTAQLLPPFRDAALPVILSPEDAANKLTDLPE